MIIIDSAICNASVRANCVCERYACYSVKDLPRLFEMWENGEMPQEYAKTIRELHTIYENNK